MQNYKNMPVTQFINHLLNTVNGTLTPQLNFNAVFKQPNVKYFLQRYTPNITRRTIIKQAKSLKNKPLHKIQAFINAKNNTTFAKYNDLHLIVNYTII